ncbi:MAG: hypothetical protein JJE22_07885, partial [Bacteroidia bacterium]|nr:hypothetical protein [Bacteroidia bacterium]
MTLKPYIILAILFFTAFVAAAQSYNNIEFIENKGQWDSQVKYKGDVNAGAFFIRSTGFTVLQHNQKDLQVVQDMMHGHNDEGTPVSRNQSLKLRSHAYKVDFLG